MRTLLAVSVLLASTAVACAKAPPAPETKTESAPAAQPGLDPAPAPPAPEAKPEAPAAAPAAAPATKTETAPAKVAKNDSATGGKHVLLPRRPMKASPRAKSVTSNVADPWGTAASPTPAAAKPAAPKASTYDDPWSGGTAAAPPPPAAKDLKPYD
jgi:hypothetical protein